MERKKIVIRVSVIAVLVAGMLLPGHIRLKKLRKENERYRQRIAILEDQNKELEKETVFAKEDPGYLEKKARDKLGIVRKGEIIYRGPTAHEE
ncbi:MAG: septum formation initiator family protein [Candidatus Omnitrophota bacterium]